MTKYLTLRTWGSLWTTLGRCFSRASPELDAQEAPTVKNGEFSRITPQSRHELVTRHAPSHLGPGRTARLPCPQLGSSCILIESSY